MKKTALDKIVAYLKGKKKGATAPEIAHYAKVNYNTARKELGWSVEDSKYFSGAAIFFKEVPKKCRITGKHLTVYKLAA